MIINYLCHRQWKNGRYPFLETTFLVGSSGLMISVHYVVYVLLIIYSPSLIKDFQYNMISGFHDTSKLFPDIARVNVKTKPNHAWKGGGGIYTLDIELGRHGL
jgi:hypothetical protein